MWWSDGVASAIKNCQLRRSILVILVEPPEHVLEKRESGSETSEQMLSRLSTSSMHRITFVHPVVTTTIRDSQAVCLKFPSNESNADFKAFSVYFKLYGIPPNLYFISPLTGQTLVHKSGFVSPKVFLDSLAATTRNVSGRVLTIPEIEPHTSAATKSISLSTVPAPQDGQYEEKDECDGVDTEPQNLAKLTPQRNADHTRTALFSESGNISPQGRASVASTPAAAPSKSMKLPGGTKGASEEDARLLARLPGGGQVRKSFSGTTRFSVVRSWLSEEVKSPMGAVVISTAFPRKVFDRGEDPKMLSELGLVPSETLIVAVAVRGDAVDPAPRGQAANAQATYGLRTYAASALAIVGGFFRSFVADNPNAAPRGQEETQPRLANATPQGVAPSRVPSAMRIDRPRTNRPEIDDDENLLSNGNSTQYGWNPRDEEEDQT